MLIRRRTELETPLRARILRAMAPSSGAILFHTAAGGIMDLAPLSRKELRPLRPQIQMIFQDPFGSLNPRCPFVVDRCRTEPLRCARWTAMGCAVTARRS